MNKFTKSILALGLALSIIIGVGGVSVFAWTRNDTKYGSINGCQTTAISTLNDTSASATTKFTNTGLRSVKSTYTYVNVRTLAAKTATKFSSGMNNVSVSFSSPKDYRSVQIRSFHHVNTAAQTWEVNTGVSV